MLAHTPFRPLTAVCAVANSKGEVKISVQNPSADPPLRPDGKLNVGAAVGKGILAVVRSHPLMKEPYTGMIPIYSGEVAEDLAHYLQDSEQTNSAIALGVSINRDTSVRSAGGFLVQASACAVAPRPVQWRLCLPCVLRPSPQGRNRGLTLPHSALPPPPQVLPFASDETLTELEKNIGSLPSITEMLQQGLDARGISARILGELGCEEINMTEVEPRYGPCEVEALKARMKRAVVSLGEAEVDDIVKEHGAVKARQLLPPPLRRAPCATGQPRTHAQRGRPLALPPLA